VPASTLYEQIPYSNHPYRQAHHDQLAVTGVLHGLEPPAPATASVLEIGCGSGGHLIATCYAMPGVRAVGVDLAPSVIEGATVAAREACVDNVEFHAADLRDLTDGRFGRFDYVVAHGVQTWIPDDAREALPAAMRAHLADDGLAYISYNVHPGGHLRGILRDACLFHARGARDERERIALAREMLELLLRWRASDEQADAYGRFLAEVLPRFIDAADGTLAHDLLSEHGEPIWYHDFVALAGAHDLVPVAESRLIEPPGLPREPGLRDAIDRLADGDAVVREQLKDLFGNGRFRETVLAPASAGALAEPDPRALRRLRFLGPPPPGGAPPGTVAVVAAVAAARPRASTFEDLRGATGMPAEALESALLEAMRASLLTGWLEPPRAIPAGPRPHASALARRQAREGRPATSLLHSVVILDPAGAQLLDLLDGTRDHGAVASAMLEATGLELSPEAVASNIDKLAVAGLLEAVEAG
jgi:SAM-dependent methyltransferase